MNWEKFREDLDKAFVTVGNEYGLRLEAKTIRYDDISVRFTVEGIFLQEGEDADQILFEKDCVKFGISPDMYGVVIRVKDKSYKIIGVNTRARKYPLVIKGEDGIRRKATLGILPNKEK